ncbi:hypothetical protein GTP46_04230 [Duganella sp. FT135W]|uniref:MACPF domain-containing protein n=1 Tax=Duganella flavida TaxID=2692175 RepID=A0A6L8K6P1_9BURK|nr:MAC/perforin domain-containing protein [Duganella flavida]MYM21858.1 hypothetical protein [Duganella flavida]
MNDGIDANDIILEIGGLNELGRGINRLDVGTRCKLSTNRVADSQSGNKTIIFVDGSKQTTFRMGDKVSYELSRSDAFSEDIFQNTESYHTSLNASAEATINYGAFSSDFKFTFGRDIDSLREYSAALHTRAMTLWQLTLPANADGNTTDFNTKLGQLPKPFDANSAAVRSAYFNFFNNYGTDVVTEVIVGGALNYALMIEKSHLSDITKIDFAAKAEYASYVHGKASVQQQEEVKKNSQHVIRTLSTRGGNYNFNFSQEAPENYQKGLEGWRATVASAPSVVKVRTKPITEFVGDPAIRKNLEDAYKWYAYRDLLMTSSWDGSVIAIGEVVQKPGHDVPTGPRLRLLVLDGDIKVSQDDHFTAPANDASPAAFQNFWRNMAEKLNAIDPSNAKVLLATECWPRDKRYTPTVDMLEALLKHGANRSTLDRWKALTNKMAPCRLAGLTYTLAGNRLSTAGIDGLSVGFATRNEDPSANVTIFGRLSRDAMQWLKLTELNPTIASSTTQLRSISNAQTGLAMALDPDDSTRIVMQAVNASSDEQLWFFHELEPRDTNPTYRDIHNPCLVINYKTGRALQGFRNQTESKLQDLQPQLQDDVVWDHRGGDKNCNLLMVYFWMDALNLKQEDSSVRVRPWLQEPMRWNLTTVSK